MSDGTAAGVVSASTGRLSAHPVTELFPPAPWRSVARTGSDHDGLREQEGQVACIGSHLYVEPRPAIASGSRTGSSTHAVVLLGRPLRAAVFTSVITSLARLGFDVRVVRRLADGPVTALELLVSTSGSSSGSTAVLRNALAEVAASGGIDVAVEPVSPRRGAQRLVVFDVDSTLLRGEAIDMLAVKAGREREVCVMTEAAMCGEIDFTESLRSRVSVLAGLPAAMLDEVAARAELAPGARTTVRTLRRRGFRCGAISGGFSQVVQPVATELGLDFFAANELEIRGGRLTGQLVGEVIDRRAKAAVLRRFASCYGIPLSRCVAVGDGANDIDMLATAGLGVAFNAKPALREIADTTLSQSSMDTILFVLGIAEDEIMHRRGAHESEVLQGSTSPVSDWTRHG